MDIAGAKALKKRLGPNGADTAAPTSVDVPEDAPPVYRWTGVAQPPSVDADHETVDDAVSLFRRLGLSFR
jgi:hypothetical protein